MKKITLFAVTSCAALLAQADPSATCQAIAAALNKRDVEGVMRTMDVDAVTRRSVSAARVPWPGPSST